MDLKVDIRELKNDEISHLDNFLYDAIFIPEGQKKPDKEIIKLPELSGYIKDFGKDTDHCLVAELNGELIGAIWIRIFSEDEKGFGFIDSKTPELSMSVVENYRKKGIGTKMLKACLLYTSDAADERSSVDLGGRRIIKKKNREYIIGRYEEQNNDKKKQE